MDKTTIRDKIRVQIKSLSYQVKESMDEIINMSLINLLHDKYIQKVHLFIPMGNEVDIRPFIVYLLNHDFLVYTSESLRSGELRHWRLYSLNELQSGMYGTKFPANSTTYSGTYNLIIVPGLAFTMEGDRIGYGAGYYDRFLSNHSSVCKVGVCYKFQIYDTLPVESFDIQMDKLIVG